MKLYYVACLLALVPRLNGAATEKFVVFGGRHAWGGPQDISRRADGHVQLYKRVSNSKWTFYDVGFSLFLIVKLTDNRNAGVPAARPMLQAILCVATLAIVALDTALFGTGYPGPHCFQTITMTYNGKTTTARIMDRCPGCPYGGLDLSRDLFQFFDSLDKGVIYGSWSFGSQGSDDGDSEPATTKQPPETTQRATTTKTTTRTPASASIPPTGTSSTYSTPSSYANTTVEVNYSSGLAIPVATGVADSDNLSNINTALVDLGALVIAGALVD
ncbi:hypothetical protein AN958_02414 [Leucoagaricus sp. SymC.cos]|nr:hypothetical protein AN958_02414 [Leucoagaricus sp. SymC.cos]